MTPDNGTTVGIGQPIVVRFLSAVTERAAVQKVLTVKATTTSGKSVAGSWSWLNDQQIDWRPDTFWEPGTSVSLSMKIAGVKAARVHPPVGVNAKSFYQHAVAGDVVVVTHSGRGPQERIATQDPGLYDWNVSREVWKRDSAL